MIEISDGAGDTVEGIIWSPALQPRWKTGTLDVRDVLSWGPGEYNSALKKSATKRVKLPVLQRNARIVQHNLNTLGGST